LSSDTGVISEYLDVAHASVDTAGMVNAMLDQLATGSLADP